MSKQEKKRSLSLIINQSEVTKVYSIYFETMTYGWMPHRQKQLVLGEKGLPETWMEDVEAYLEEENFELFELRCYATFDNYDFLKNALFHGLRHLYIFGACGLRELSFLDKMNKLRTLRIEGAKLEDLSPLVSLLERQEEGISKMEHYDFLDADELGCLGLVKCSLKDLSGFAHLKRPLEELHFSYNDIEDIRPVAHLVLSHAFFQHNKIKIGFAELCENMTYPVDINIRHNLIDDNEVARLFELSPEQEFIHLYIHHNLIKDYSPFKDRGLTRTDITDEELNAITKLDLIDEAYELLK